MMADLEDFEGRQGATASAAIGLLAVAVVIVNLAVTGLERSGDAAKPDRLVMAAQGLAQGLAPGSRAERGGLDHE